MFCLNSSAAYWFKTLILAARMLKLKFSIREKVNENLLISAENDTQSKHRFNIFLDGIMFI